MGEKAYKKERAREKSETGVTPKKDGGNCSHFIDMFSNFSKLHEHHPVDFEGYRKPCHEIAP